MTKIKKNKKPNWIIHKVLSNYIKIKKKEKYVIKKIKL